MERVVAIGLTECMPLITERLSSGQSVEFMAHGTSMKPMLHDSYVTLSPAPKRLVRGDLPLCRRGNGSFVLHRVVRVHSNGSYTLCGDNQTKLEHGFTRDDVIGIVTAFDKDGVNVAADSAEYLRYVKKRLASRPLRRCSELLYHLYARLKKHGG